MGAQITTTALFRPVRTRDGSLTLRSEAVGEQYHSRHGAVLESRYVFIGAGLKAIKKAHISVLEVGLGTGLNALLTWVEAERSGITIDYHAMEPCPLSIADIDQLDHTGHLGVEGKRTSHLRMMASRAERIEPDACFGFTCSISDVRELDLVDRFDLVYFDAFSPEKQPELWTDEVFSRVFRAMRPGALLVTYCAKGEVRRAMIRTGFTVERLKGPPGKREMFRATRPSR